jgi:hypothetical protein
MVIKWKTLLKGVLWEVLGVACLFVASLLFTSLDVKAASWLSVGWGVFRAVTFYPYERVFKRATRTWIPSIEIEAKKPTAGFTDDELDHLP